MRLTGNSHHGGSVVPRAQPDWEATRAIVQAAIVVGLRDFVADAPDERSMRVEADGGVIVRHSGRSWRWWVDPEAATNIASYADSPSYVPWQVEIWVRDDPPRAPRLAERLRNAVSPHSHATGIIRAGEDDPGGRAAAIVRRELARQTSR